MWGRRNGLDLLHPDYTKERNKRERGHSWGFGATVQQKENEYIYIYSAESDLQERDVADFAGFISFLKPEELLPNALYKGRCNPKVLDFVLKSV